MFKLYFKEKDQEHNPVLLAEGEEEYCKGFRDGILLTIPALAREMVKDLESKYIIEKVKEEKEHLCTECGLSNQHPCADEHYYKFTEHE